MYAKHDFVTTPPGSTIIWRYIKVDDFQMMVNHGTLHFTRLDKFDDDHEGSVPLENHRRRLAGIRTPLPGQYPDVNHIVPPYLSNDWRLYNYASCWHMHKHENALMWQCYVAQGKGVAIRSSVKRMKLSFGKGYPPHIFIGRVKYRDFDTDYQPIDNFMRLAYLKRIEFGMEKELRALYVGATEIEPRWRTERGILLKCDMDVLIDEVKVARDAFDEVKAMSQGRPWTVKVSDMHRVPTF